MNFFSNDKPESMMRLQSFIVTLTCCICLFYLAFKYNIWEAIIWALAIAFAGKSLQKAIEEGKLAIPFLNKTQKEENKDA